MSRINVAVLICAALVACDRPVDAPAPTAELVEDPWLLSGAQEAHGANAFQSCASCHMADGSGRADGSIPRLAGQIPEVIIQKMQKLRDRKANVPAMMPFARSLSPQETSDVAHYLSTLPVPSVATPTTDGAAAYTTWCAGCHGATAQGNAALLAPRLCGQHARYITRRLQESVANVRGDADPAMAAIVAAVPVSDQHSIANWLAQGHCTIADNSSTSVAGAQP